MRALFGLWSWPVTLLVLVLLLGAPAARASAPECVEAAPLEHLLSTFAPSSGEVPLPRELRPKRSDLACRWSAGRLLCFRRTRGLAPEWDHERALIGLYRGDEGTARLERLCHVSAKYSREEVKVSFLHRPGEPEELRTLLRLDYPSGWGTGFHVTHTALLDLSDDFLVGPVFPSACRIASLGLQVNVQGQLSAAESMSWSMAYRFTIKDSPKQLDASGKWTARYVSLGEAKEPDAEADPVIEMLNALCETHFPS